MKTKFYCLTLPIAAAASLVLAAPHSASAQDTAAADQEEMMKAFKEFIAPGPQHKQLKTLVGEWKTTQKLWMAPGAPPVESPGTATFRMLMGGRYLLQTYSSEMPGIGKFHGRGTTAFDKVTKEYISTWIDSLSTGIMVSKGKATGENTVEMTGEITEPVTKAKVGYRTVMKFADADNYQMEMFEIRGDKERKLMEVVYKRVKGAGAKTGKKKNDKAKD
jgi:hypothetical protein